MEQPSAGAETGVVLGAPALELRKRLLYFRLTAGMYAPYGLALYQDGRLWRMSWTGEGMVEPFADNPKTLELARGARSDTVWGLPLLIGGGVFAFGGGALALLAAGTSRVPLMIAGAALAVV